MRDDLTAERIKMARAVAITADVLQIVLVPTFFPAALSPAANVIDLVTAVVLYRLLGWHWSFLPTFAAELVPFVDLAPTWTAAVFLATRKGAPAGEAPEVVVETTAEPVEQREALRPGPEPPRGRSGSRGQEPSGS